MAQRGGRRAGAGRPKGKSVDDRFLTRTQAKHAAAEVTQVFTATRVLEEIAALAFVDIGELFTDRGTLKPLSGMTERARRAIIGLKSTKYNKPGEKDGVQEDVVELKLAPKTDALRMAAQYHGLLVETKVDATGDKEIRARMRRGEERAREAAR